MSRCPEVPQHSVAAPHPTLPELLHRRLEVENIFFYSSSRFNTYLWSLLFTKTMSYVYTSMTADPPEIKLSDEESWPESTVCSQADDLARRKPLCKNKALYLAATAVILLLSTMFIFAPRLGHEPRPYKLGVGSASSCGNSSTEALAAGCEFDIMSFTWSRPACFDRDLMNDFLVLQNWTWWFDDAGELPLNLADVEAGQHQQLFVTWEYHLVHCTYMWKKMHRAISAGRPVDSYIGSINHTNHCEMMLLTHEVDMGERNTIIRVKYPSCPDA